MFYSTYTYGQQAIDIFQDLKGDITCVILDITMPGPGGVAVMEQINTISPSVPIILSSGYTEEEIIETSTKTAPWRSSRNRTISMS